MNDLSLTIVDFVRHSDVLNDQTLSETQIACVKSVYGLPLTDRELEIYRRGTGRETYDATEQREATFIAGRRGGKTGKIAAPIVCYEAFRDHGLPTGEQGYVMLLAPTLKQSKIAFRYIRKYLRNSRILSKRIVRMTKDEITLDNNIVIGCYACTHDGVRGRTIVAVVCDEIGFWPDGDEAADPAEEVLTALRPGMATVRNAKLIKISTPFTKSGILWDEFQRRTELAYPVWQLTTFEMNPTLTPEMVESERRLSQEKYQREYLAQFTDSINGWIVPEILNPCIVRGRRELPRQCGVNYIAAIDPASRGNDFALVIVHQNLDGTVVVDRVDSWIGTKKAPLPFESVLLEIKTILETYGINNVIGDQFYCDPISQFLLKLGIFYKLSTFSTLTRGKLFSGLKHLMVQGKIEILDDVELLRQLRNLREEKTPRGQIDVRPSSGKDDKAVALALASNESVTQKSALPFEWLVVDLRPSPTSLGLIPEDCYLASVCGNFPTCMDVGECQGFKDERVSA